MRALWISVLLGCSEVGDDHTLVVEDGVALEMAPDEWPNPMRCTIEARAERTDLSCDGRPAVRLGSADRRALTNAVRAIAWDELRSIRDDERLEGGGFTTLHLTRGSFDRTWDVSNSTNARVRALVHEVSRVRRDVAGPGAACASDTACFWGYCEERRCVQSPCTGDDGTWATEGRADLECAEGSMAAIRDRAWRCIDRRSCE